MVTPSATGRRCREDSLPDTDPPRCARHLHQYDAKSEGHMHRFYGHTFRPALRAAVAAMLEDVPMVEQLDGREELALLRVAAGHAVEKYSEVCESGNLEAKLLAGVMMREQLEAVLDAIKTVGSIEELKLKVTGALAMHLQAFVGVIVKAASDVFQDDYRVRDFENRVRELLEARPVGQGLEGTVLTPDQDVIAMDATIPAAEAQP